jgi:integrase
MKSKGRHPERALTAVQVRQIKQPGRYTDGNGLYLVVDPSGARRWLLRIVVKGRRRDIGLGSATLVSLAEAREAATSYRKIAREGGDPLVVKRTAVRQIPSFKDAMELVHAEHEVSWKNQKHAQQWINTLRQYAVPVIGDHRVDAIDTPDVLRVLSPIWLARPETARRVKQRIGTVLDWARASGFRSGDNPVEGVLRGLPKQTTGPKHHAALPFAEVPAFIQALRSSGGTETAKLAFEFLILTTARTSEVLQAEKSEFDLDGALWTVPAERMKAKRIHRVPLSPRCVEILTAASTTAKGSVYAFTGKRARDDELGKPLSNMVFLATLKRMDLPITAHGFRSAFRDWAAEATSYPREVAELALAHTIQNKVEAAYRRGDLLDKRRAMMNDWAAYCATLPEKSE